jgi:hypothetical protein
MLRLQCPLTLPRYIEPYHFQANLAWWDVPFKDMVSQMLDLILGSINQASIFSDSENFV